MNGFAILQRNHAKGTTTQLGHEAPIANPSVRLNLRRRGLATILSHHSRRMYGRLRKTCSSKYRVILTLLLIIRGTCPQKQNGSGAILSRLIERYEIAAAEFNPGDDRLSHAVTRVVPWALEGLTSVFGMGTGVAPPV